MKPFIYLSSVQEHSLFDQQSYNQDLENKIIDYVSTHRIQLYQQVLCPKFDDENSDHAILKALKMQCFTITVSNNESSPGNGTVIRMAKFI